MIFLYVRLNFLWTGIELNLIKKFYVADQPVMIFILS